MLFSEIETFKIEFDSSLKSLFYLSAFSISFLVDIAEITMLNSPFRNKN